MCDYYKGLGYPEYLINDQELHRNMSFIYNIFYHISLYGESKYNFWFSDDLFYMMQEYANKSSL